MKSGPWTGFLVALAVTMEVNFSPSVAQVRCEPTLTQPCKPPVSPAPAIATQPQKPREGATRLDPQPLLPDIKLDKDTSMGFGHGGVIGLERKF